MDGLVITYNNNLTTEKQASLLGTAVQLSSVHVQLWQHLFQHQVCGVHSKIRVQSHIHYSGGLNALG